MNNTEKATCEWMMKEGTIQKVVKAVSAEGIQVECYEMIYLGETYHMTKNNGEWVYFIHC